MTLAVEVRKAPFQSGGRPRVHFWARFTVGAAGAVTLDSSFSDPNIALGAFSSGVADLTFPIAPKGQVIATIRPAALANDQVIYVTDLDTTAGTAELTVADDGSAEDPAEGAVIDVQIVLETRGG